MNMFEHYQKTVTENYTNFKGKATREEFRSFFLVHTLIPILMLIIASLQYFFLQKYLVKDLNFRSTEFWALFFRIYWTYLLITLLPRLAVWVRRARDLGLNVWVLISSTLPLILLAPILHYSIQDMVIIDMKNWAIGNTPVRADYAVALLAVAPYAIMYIILLTKKNKAKAKK